jgi:uncharacterized membrane protein
MSDQKLNVVSSVHLVTLVLSHLMKAHSRHVCIVDDSKSKDTNELCFWTLSIVWCLKNKQN